MFEFYHAARQQYVTGERVVVSRHKRSVNRCMLLSLLFCLWLAGMVLTGGYARQIWMLWMVTVETTTTPEAPPFKQSAQHYFFKKQPLPVKIEEPASEPEKADVDENVPEATEDDGSVEDENVDKANLRERVQKAFNSLEQ